MGEGWVNSRGACSNTALLSSNRSNLQIAIHSNAEMLKSKRLKNCSGLSVRLHFWSQKVLPLNGEGDDEEIMWTKATEFLVCSSNSTFQKKNISFIPGSNLQATKLAFECCWVCSYKSACLHNVWQFFSLFSDTSFSSSSSLRKIAT